MNRSSIGDGTLDRDGAFLLSHTKNLSVCSQNGFKQVHIALSNRGSMKVGIIGAGNVGSGLAKRLAPKDHEVMLSYSRDLTKLEAVAESLGAKSGSIADAVAFAEVVVLATPYSAIVDALKQARSPASGKILWDCTTPLKPDFSGLLIGTTTSAGEEVASLAPWARVVKAVPPFAEVLHSDDMNVGGGPPGVFVCGDDQQACESVATLIKDIDAEPILTGPLVYSRFIEPANMLLVALAYRNGFGPRVGLFLRHS